MTAAPSAPVEQAAAAHAQHILAADMGAIQRDCSAQVLQEPADLYQQLVTATFERYTILGHAKIGWHHVLKIRYFGATTATVHHRFGAVDGTWVVLESERV